MPMDRKKYPPDWDSISWRIRFVRARGLCEECGVPHGATIMRSTANPAYYLELAEDGCWYTPGGEMVRISELPDEFDDSKIIKVRLTTHHKGVPKPNGMPGDRRDKMDCREENLAALCERCHFLADQDLNITSRRRTRNNKKHQRRLEAGQKELW